mgnify:CR=1 FL=1
MTTTWIAIFSNDLDEGSIKEIEIQAETETEANDKIDEIDFDSSQDSK